MPTLPTIPTPVAGAPMTPSCPAQARLGPAFVPTEPLGTVDWLSPPCLPVPLRSWSREVHLCLGSRPGGWGPFRDTRGARRGRLACAGSLGAPLEQLGPYRAPHRTHGVPRPRLGRVEGRIQRPAD
jgi:hypothetical protein